MALRQQHLVEKVVILKLKENIVTLNEVESCEGEEQAGVAIFSEGSLKLNIGLRGLGGKLIKA